jgi:hypothetical protein
VEVATTRIPHLEGEEIFGSTKRKLDLPPCDDGNSHRPDKVNFSQPLVQTRSRTAHTEVAGASVVGTDKDELPHVTTALESDCDMSHRVVTRKFSDGRTDGRSNDGRGGVRDLDAL